MKTLITLLLLTQLAIGAEIVDAKSDRVLAIEKKFKLEFVKLASQDDGIWWVFMYLDPQKLLHAYPVCVHVDAPDDEVSASLESSATTAKFYDDAIKDIAMRAKEKSKK
jgi:hypothetical protein